MMDDPILYPLDAHLPAPLPNVVFSSKSNLNITATTNYINEAAQDLQKDQCFDLKLEHSLLFAASRHQNPLSMVSKNLTLGT